jgi:CheY-like chemotaxis protein
MMEQVRIHMGKQKMRHVLVVEDDEDVRTALHAGLEASGFRVSAASQARDALALVDLDRPDVVLTDVIMPGMLGVDLVPQLVRRDIPVLVMTGIPDARSHLDDVGWRHLVKPFRIEALLVELHSVLTDATQNLAMIRDTFARSFKARATPEVAIPRDPPDEAPSATVAANWSGQWPISRTAVSHRLRSRGAKTRKALPAPAPAARDCRSRPSSKPAFVTAGPVTIGDAPSPQETARQKRRRAIHVALPLLGGLLGALGMPVLLHSGHSWAFLLYALAIVIACNIVSVAIDPPE